MIREICFGIIPLMKEGGVLKILVIQHRKGGYWVFPKGHASAEETPQATAQRELKEETGLHIVSYINVPPLHEEYEVVREGNKITKEVIYFPAWVSGTLHLQNQEITDSRWVSFEEALKLISYDNLKEPFRALFSSLSQEFLS